MEIPSFKKILYATDMGENMRPVFRHAIGLAKEYQGQIVMLHVAEPLNASAMMALEAYLPEGTEHDFSEEGSLKRVLAEMKERLEAFYHDEMQDDPDKGNLVSDIIVASGNTSEEITEHAKKLDVDLIVVGTHTSSGMGHGFIGSAARRVIHDADRPVLVVPVFKK